VVTEKQVRVGRHIVASVGAYLRRRTIIRLEAEDVEREQLGVKAVAEYESHGRHRDQKESIHPDVAI